MHGYESELLIISVLNFNYELYLQKLIFKSMRYVLTIIFSFYLLFFQCDLKAQILFPEYKPAYVETEVSCVNTDIAKRYIRYMKYINIKK